MSAFGGKADMVYLTHEPSRHHFDSGELTGTFTSYLFAAAAICSNTGSVRPL